MKGINWIAAIIATAVGVGIGILWYGYLFADKWQALTGVTGDADPTIMAVGALNTLIAAVGLSWLVNKLDAASLSGGVKTGLAVGVFFSLTTAALGFIYAGANTGLIPIDFGYLIVLYAVMGGIVGAVKIGAKS